jgi:hypothetical protein
MVDVYCTDNQSPFRTGVMLDSLLYIAVNSDILPTEAFAKSDKHEDAAFPDEENAMLISRPLHPDEDDILVGKMVHASWSIGVPTLGLLACLAALIDAILIVGRRENFSSNQHKVMQIVLVILSVIAFSVTCMDISIYRGSPMYTVARTHPHYDRCMQTVISSTSSPIEPPGHSMFMHFDTVVLLATILGFSLILHGMALAFYSASPQMLVTVVVVALGLIFVSVAFVCLISLTSRDARHIKFSSDSHTPFPRPGQLIHLPVVSFWVMSLVLGFIFILDMLALTLIEIPSIGFLAASTVAHLPLLSLLAMLFIDRFATKYGFARGKPPT